MLQRTRSPPTGVVLDKPAAQPAVEDSACEANWCQLSVLVRMASAGSQTQSHVILNRLSSSYQFLLRPGFNLFCQRQDKWPRPASMLIAYPEQQTGLNNVMLCVHCMLTTAPPNKYLQHCSRSHTGLQHAQYQN